VKYSTNFFKQENPPGNSIKTLTHLEVELKDVDFASGAIYQDGFPVIADFDDNKDGKVILDFYLAQYSWADGSKKLVGLDPGTYTLKVRAYKDGRGGNGIDDEFFIV